MKQQTNYLTYSVKEVAHTLGVSDQFVRDYARNLKLPKPGKSYLIIEEEVERLRLFLKR